MESRLNHRQVPQDTTSIYVEDLDYRLITIGSITSIQRLITGNISDGETVLVDTAANPPGTPTTPVMLPEGIA